MNETTLTITGNLTADPELRFTPSGAAVCNFTVASTPRKFDKASGGWRDAEAIFMRCTVWRQLAENVAESLTRGSAVIVTGRLESKSFETREGDKRTVLELQVDEVGASLKFATVKVSKAERKSGAAGGSASSEGQFDDEPPF
jgi:single-strand DNA-binding protein